MPSTFLLKQNQIDQLRSMILTLQGRSEQQRDIPKTIAPKQSLNPISNEDNEHEAPGLNNRNVPGYDPRSINRTPKRVDSIRKEKDYEAPGKTIQKISKMGPDHNQRISPEPININNMGSGSSSRGRERSRSNINSNSSRSREQALSVYRERSQIQSSRKKINTNTNVQSTNNRNQINTTPQRNVRPSANPPTASNRRPSSVYTAGRRSSVQTAERIRSSPLCMDGVKMLYKNREYQRWCVCNTDVCERIEKKTACGRASLEISVVTSI